MISSCLQTSLRKIGQSWPLLFTFLYITVFDMISCQYKILLDDEYKIFCSNYRYRLLRS